MSAPHRSASAWRPWLTGALLLLALQGPACSCRGTGQPPGDGTPPPAGGPPRGVPGDGQPVDGTDAGVPPPPVLGEGVGLAERPPNPTCLAPPRPTVVDGAEVQPAFPQLRFEQPVLALQAPGDTSRIYVVERTGRVRVFPNDEQAAASTVFVDLRDRVSFEDSQEMGLLGMAFHPDFATTGEVFLSYTAVRDGQRTSVISRFLSRDGGATLDPASEEEVLALEQPRSNHNGGHIQFGPDGYLYAGFGDGGGAQDPDRNGQNLDTLLGKMLRLDVDGARPYAIPEDNPLEEGEGRREIWAWGFRNPWRWSFDRVGGQLWLGDVGEKAQEEVDLVVAGGNYGWSEMEGTACLRDEDCDTTLYVAPVATYGRDQGVAITGGYVYRGSALPSLYGRYVFGDYGSGNIWALVEVGPGQYESRLLVESGAAISSFGELNDGELLVVDLGAGRLLRLVPPGKGAIQSLPRMLSQTGCVDPAAPHLPAAGVLPYDVNAPLWSDGADKERFLALPDGTSMREGPQGRWELPVGSVLVKSFLVGGRRVETRLFMRHPDGNWAGYTYEWLDDQTDAVLLEGSKTKVVDGLTWYFPSRGDCMQCHTAASGDVLGLETAQLNRELDYPGGRRGHQLTTLAALGMLTLPGAETPHTLPRLPSPFGEAPVEERARAYLHGNCSHCHLPGGLGRGPMDLRASTPLAQAGLCGVAPELDDLGVDGAQLLFPGHPEASVVPLRMRALDATRMPPLATSLVDVEGVALLEAWISTLGACPQAP